MRDTIDLKRENKMIFSFKKVGVGKKVFTFWGITVQGEYSVAKTPHEKNKGGKR